MKAMNGVRKQELERVGKLALNVVLIGVHMGAGKNTANWTSIPYWSW